MPTPRSTRTQQPQYHDEDFVSLRDYFDTRFTAMEERTEQARMQMEKRLDGMNEFRETLRDQASKFITAAEVDIIVQRLDAEIRSLQITRAMLEGKASQSSLNITMIISIIGLMIGIISALLRYAGQ